jgi:hypothetical protein
VSGRRHRVDNNELITLRDPLPKDKCWDSIVEMIKNDADVALRFVELCAHSRGNAHRLKCKHCQEEFLSLGDKNAFCSVDCKLDWHGIRRQVFETKECITCGEDFTPRAASSTCCSRKCASRSRLRLQGKYIGDVYYPNGTNGGH